MRLLEEWFPDSEGRINVDGECYSEEQLSLVGVTALSCAGSRFERCQFSGGRIVDLRGRDVQADGPGAVFRDCTFTRTNFRLHLIRDVSFERCTFRNVNWRKCMFNSVDFMHCRFQGKMRDVRFVGPEYTGDESFVKANIVEGNDFTQSELTYVELWGNVGISPEMFRSGDGLYLVNSLAGFEAAAHRFMESHDGESRKIMEIKLRSLKYAMERGQRQFLITERDHLAGDKDLWMACLAYLVDTGTVDPL